MFLNRRKAAPEQMAQLNETLDALMEATTEDAKAKLRRKLDRVVDSIERTT